MAVLPVLPVLPMVATPAFAPVLTVDAAAPASVRTGYSVQVYSLQYAGRFTNDVVSGLKRRFERSLVSWKERGYAPFLYRAELADANLEISICIGAFDTPSDAATLAQQIKDSGQLVAVVVPVELHDGRPMPLDAHLKRAATAQAGPAPSQLPLPQSLTMTGASQ